MLLLRTTSERRPRPPSSNDLQPPRPRSAPPVTNDYYPQLKNTRSYDASVTPIALQHFTKGLLPWVDPSRIAHVYDALKASGSIYRSKIGSVDRWSVCPVAPYGSTPSVDSVSARLRQAIDAIAHAAGLPDEAQHIIECVPVLASSSCATTTESAPAHVRADSQNLTVLGYISQNDDGEGCIDSKMLADMHKLMRDDPARRFVYGFTLEDMQMRLWHVSRAGSFVSYSFDFATNPRYAISFFLPLLLATKTELGLDPTITLADTPRATAEATFDITVGEKTYRTQRLLSTAGGTRWWEVRALDGLGNEVGGALTLKDAWVEIGQPTEGEILRDATGTMKEEEKACFMRVAAESRVYVDGALDQTPVVVRCGGKVVDVRRPPAAGGGPARAAGGEGKIKMLFALPGLEDRMADIISSTKVHHRIVFDEVGKSIAELDSLQQVFECLGDAVEGLQALHARGWVHRGISEDSIAQVNGRGKLVRVEHAVKRGEECTPVTNTSPPYLTPIEVTRGEYLFATFPHTPPPTIAIPDISRAELRRRHAEFAARMQEAQAAAARAPQPAPPIRPRFAPNALHDLEAVFWLALRVLLCSSLRAPVGVAAADWGRCMETRREAAREVFGGEVRRRAMLASEACLAEVLRGLGPVLARIGAALECVRGELVRRYREVEVECRGVGDGDAAAGLHVKFRAWFFYVAGLLEREDIAINVHGEL